MSPEKIEKMPWQIETKEELKLVAAYLGVRDNWHEPDEQDVTVEVYGRNFDNAGFWGKDIDLAPEAQMEMWVTIRKSGIPIAEVNLATLFAFACDTYDGADEGAKTHWSTVLKQAMKSRRVSKGWSKTAILDKLIEEATKA